jgi:Ser/Thr protein kinase RdoA (MazF antagonist)
MAGPYGDLTPDVVLEALDASGHRGDGRMLQLNSYENRVFQVFLENGSVVVAKFYRPRRWSDAQIVEEHAFALQLAEAEVPVVPPLPLVDHSEGMLALRGEPPTLASWADGRNAHRWSVSARRAGREPELEQHETLQVLGRFIGRLHQVGRREAFVQRRQMALVGEARQAVRFLLEGGFVPPTQQPVWAAAAQAAITQIERQTAALPGICWLRLHGDCHLGNVLWRDGLPHIVDLDDACGGPAVQDLWMLVSGDATTMHQQLDALLVGYTQFSDFDRRELALIEPLRTLRMLRHSAWIAERWGDPTFPIHFAHFGSDAYWSQQAVQLREQAEAMAPA